MSKVSRERPNGAATAKDIEHRLLLHKQRENDHVHANGHHPFYAMAPGKNDYSWLMSPPEFPSLEVESQVPREKLISQPLSRFAGKSEVRKAGTQRSISPNWKPNFFSRFSSPTGRSNVLLVGKKNNTSEQVTIQKMHQPSSQLNPENPKKALLTDRGIPCQTSSIESTGHVSQVHSNKENPSFNGNLKPIIQLSRRPSFKDVARDHDHERLNVSPILPKSSELSDQGHPNIISIGRSHLLSRMHSNAQITSFTSRVPCSQAATSDNKQKTGSKVSQNSDILDQGFTNIRTGRVSGSKFAARDCKHESKPKNSKFFDQVPPRDIMTGQSNAHIPLTNNPEMVIKYSRKSSSPSVTIPPQNPNFSNPNPPSLRTGRSQSVSRVHSSATNKPGTFINKFEPVTQCGRVSISSGVIKNCKNESDPNGLTIPPKKIEISDQPLPKLQTGRSLSVSRVHSDSQIPFSTRVLGRSLSVSHVHSDSQIPSSTRVLGRSLSVSRVHSDSQTPSSTRVSNMEQGSRTQVVGSKMLDKFLKTRMTKLEESHPKCRQNTSITEGLDTRRPTNDGRQSKTKFNSSIYDCSSFSKSICKTSLDKALKHMEHRRDSNTSSINSLMAGRRSVSVSKRSSS